MNPGARQAATTTLDERARVRLADGQRRVLELLARGAPIHESLTALCEALEEHLPAGLCSVLLLDRQAGTLRHGAAPRLPRGYCEAIDGSPIGPRAGSCGTAAFEGREVACEDIAHDPLWETYRDVARPYSLASCASVPIHGAQREVLGTFALYYRMAGPFDPGALALLRDASGIAALIIQSHRRDAALRENEEKLSVAVEAAGIGLFGWDLRADKMTWEAPLRRIFGLPAGEAPGDKAGFLALVHPDDRQRTGEGIAQGVATGRWEDEHRIVRADGAVRWVMVKGTVLRGEGGSTVLGAVIDVTGRRERDEARRQAQKLEAIGQLTAGIAHNFNNMLMGVLPNLSLALRRAGPEIAPLLRDAQHATERAAELVRQLMTYAGRNRPGVRRVQLLEPVVERTVAICKTTFDRGILFDTRYGGLARARVDAAQIEHALLNVLINARDALAHGSGEVPRIEVDIDVVPVTAREVEELQVPRAGSYARIRVADNGGGMDAATAARIFEPFFTTKEAGSGTGLGLAMTQAIAREHGGSITCHSVPGRGSTFSIHLPAETEASPDDGATREPPPRGGTETILVVDDEPLVRRIVALVLESAGYTVKTAASGEAALEVLRSGAPVALILLDVSMPGMPAPELRRQVRAAAPRARLVLFTGYAYEAAPTGELVLEKPVTEAHLLATVRELLDRRDGEGDR